MSFFASYLCQNCVRKIKKVILFRPIRQQDSENRFPVGRKWKSFSCPFRSLINEHARLLFSRKIKSILFSCNKLKIPPYSLGYSPVRRVGQIFHPIPVYQNLLVYQRLKSTGMVQKRTSKMKSTYSRASSGHEK